MTPTLPSSGAPLAAAIEALAQAVAQLSCSLGGQGLHGPSLRGQPPCGQAFPGIPAQAPPAPAAWPEATWHDLSVVELRALLRSTPIDRTSLPAPIEKLRRAELVEALQQLQALSPLEALSP